MTSPTAAKCEVAVENAARDAAPGGNGSLMVTASAPACAWTATSNADWLMVTSGASGPGSGPVLYSVSPNVLATDRTGTITIAGQTFTVVQLHP